jgi:hypothetical protein
MFSSKSNRIESYRKSKESFDSIGIRFDSIWAKTFDLIRKYDSIRFDSPGGQCALNFCFLPTSSRMIFTFCGLLCIFCADAPQSLKQLSRLAIRRSIRAQNLARYVPALPLPAGLKQYMLFTDERQADVENAIDDGLPDYDEEFYSDVSYDSDQHSPDEYGTCIL